MSFFLQCKRNNPCSPGGFFSAVQSILGLTQLNLSVSPLLSSSQRKVCRTSYHSSDFQFVSDSTQRPNTIHRQTKDSLRKQTSVLCRTHTCQSITATAHLFKQSKETGSYLPYFYLRYNVQHFLTNLPLRYLWFFFFISLPTFKMSPAIASR